MNKTREILYDTIVGELNRINVSSDLKEVIDLTHYLQLNIKNILR